VNPHNSGTKFAAHYVLEIESGKSQMVKLRLWALDEAPRDPLVDSDRIFAQRIKEADDFYGAGCS